MSIQQHKARFERHKKQTNTDPRKSTKTLMSAFKQGLGKFSAAIGIKEIVLSSSEDDIKTDEESEEQ